ncbi:MAG: dolichol-P-glucose synthetase-like protein [Modestobacter sp.]|jgi:hypothetical protein|nr:dolichol-P-glucose synthetase-like protein [Modestobacter sp.]
MPSASIASTPLTCSAHFLHQQARGHEEARRSSLAARARDGLRAVRGRAIARRGHEKPLIGPLLRWLGTGLPLSVAQVRCARRRPGLRRSGIPWSEASSGRGDRPGGEETGSVAAAVAWEPLSDLWPVRGARRRQRLPARSARPAGPIDQVAVRLAVAKPATRRAAYDRGWPLTVHACMHLEAGDLGRGLRAVAWERTAGQVVLLVLALVALLVLDSPVHAVMGWGVAAAVLGALCATLVLRALPQRGPSRRARVVRAARADIREGLPGRRVWPVVTVTSVVVAAGHGSTFLVAAWTTGSTAIAGTVGAAGDAGAARDGGTAQHRRVGAPRGRGRVGLRCHRSGGGSVRRPPRRPTA